MRSAIPRRTVDARVRCAVAWSAALILPSCSPLIEMTDPCALYCPDQSIAEGNSHISGLADVDAYFGTVVDVDAAAASVGDGIDAELAAIGATLGAAPGSSGAEIATRLETLLGGTLQDGLSISHPPVICEASVEAAARAAAECDADFDLDEVSMGCLGSCTVAATAADDCGPEAELRCAGIAADLLCAGSCTGACQLVEPAACAGECHGTCLDGACTVVDAQGDCAGQCTGTCQGECRLPVGGECGGACLGQCEVVSPDEVCDASMEARCVWNGLQPVACEGVCGGVAAPLQIAAACEAVVGAKARAEAHCLPPPLLLGYQWRDGIDATARAEFRAWLAGFEIRLRALMAHEKKAALLLAGLEDLVAAAEAEVMESAETTLSEAVDLHEAVSAACGIAQLPDAVAVLESVRGRLATRHEAALEVMAAVHLSQVAVDR